MAREYFRQPDIFPTITALITVSDTVAGSTRRIVLPLKGMTFDQRTDQDALISAVIAAAFGGAALPDGVQCRLLADTSAADYASGFDPRQTPLGAISFELSFESTFTGMTDVPIVFTCAGIATDAPANADLTLPTLTTNTTDITLKDFQGGALPHGFYSEVVPELSDGKSAYQIAVDNGFVGDETAWLESLKGETGDTGPAGANGTNGTDGAPGADGVGVPSGGTTGQILSKNSGTDYDTGWTDPPSGSYTPPTGTGIPHIVAGTQQSAASLIVDADIDGSAAIDASKIADGSISNAEFQYLNGVTSAIQTQLNSLAPLVSPALTGTPTAPTATTGTNTTQIATTAFVLANAGSGDGVFSAIASQAEAEAGTDNTKGMTPLRTAEAIAALATGGGGTVDDTSIRFDIYRYRF